MTREGMRRLIFFGVIFTIFSTSRAQKVNDTTDFNSTITSERIIFNFSSKTLKFNEALIEAAKEFPELEGTYIEIRRKRIGTMMAARPKPGFIFRKPDKRRYIIYITDKPGMNAEKIYSGMSYNAQLGVLGHELSHILDYKSKNNWQMLGFGIKYVFRKKAIEAETDCIAVERGFGEELIEYTRYIHHSPHVNRKYLLKKKKFYLSASELEKNLLRLM